MLVAIMFGWYSSSRRANRLLTRLAKRQEHLTAQLHFATSRSKHNNNESRNSREAKDKTVFSDARFNRVNMRGVSITGKFHGSSFESCLLQDANLNGSFQGTDFNHCNLANSTLIGDNSSFQLASFADANLSGAVVTGGGAAFQLCSFVDADLSGAVLTGGGCSFQGANFQRAKLFGARIVCPNATAFSAVIIDSAKFQGADLSAIGARALESCYFEMPPSYDGNTKFPSGFDPSKQLWQKAP